MTLVYKDRVQETSVTTGTGALTLAGATTGYQAFSVVGDGNTCCYECHVVDANGNPTGAWEVGIGTYTLAGTLLARTTVLASSNGGSAVNFSAGTKRVSLVLPAVPPKSSTLRLESGAAYATFVINVSGNITITPSGGYLTVEGNLVANGFLEGTLFNSHNPACPTTNSTTLLWQRTAESTGTPAAGFGLREEDYLENTAGVALAADRAVTLVSATFGAQKARVTMNVFDTDSRECLRMEASGAAAMIGFLGATAKIRQTLNAAASDPATTQALVNQIRQLLIDFGLAT